MSVTPEDMKPPQVPTLCTDVVGQAGSCGHFCFPWTLTGTSGSYLTSSCSELEGPRLVTHMSGALESVLGHWPDLQCLRNFPPGLFNSQVNFLHGSLGFQECSKKQEVEFSPLLRIRLESGTVLLSPYSVGRCGHRAYSHSGGWGPSPTCQGSGCQRRCGPDGMSHDSNCWVAKPHESSCNFLFLLPTQPFQRTCPVCIILLFFP